ncbi:hypothetical protein TWF569_004975 [Orbilia oligospora]|uniref:Uncharacterized protein n=1 Tax=Orbilia oligospora TaxID=2813651 RepID=A0A7C8K8P0_ORBOL|nr:hypothetical protein TWF103_003687 [Orbilia oligospora]KAF3089255.1 hypothetical protein TWF102_009746 [Orbilia oligospora]KAF3090282.1 hypothetical protein TWF706_009918 [Orbilia oligospora]KAF3126725.1 hypothetical protein TWF594_000858 [Orbilia oligospora]KAF3146660.1 hypothetical protein TWF703_003931 [Orbilia oligospora]
MGSTLKVQQISVRYIPNQKWLENQLREIFQSQPVEVTEPDNGDKWCVKVPRELTKSEILDLARKAQEENSA